jgi:hypothetical protein
MEWIKCSDKLPEQDQQVLCTNDKHEFYTAFFSRYFIWNHGEPLNQWTSGLCCGREFDEPTHWMELPMSPYGMD